MSALPIEDDDERRHLEHALAFYRRQAEQLHRAEAAHGGRSPQACAARELVFNAMCFAFDAGATLEQLEAEQGALTAAKERTPCNQ